MFTENLGKITAIAKGAKKNSNKLFPSSLPLCFGEYVLYKGKSLYTINEGIVKASFQGLLDDLEKLTYATYLCELIDISEMEGEPNRELFKTFVSAMYFMNTNALDDEMLIRTFELKLLRLTGYGMELNHCVGCKTPLKSSNYISLAYLGGVCDNCRKERGVLISRGAFNALRFLYNTTFERVYRLNLDRKTKDEIEKILSYIIQNSYSRKPKSLEMLTMFKESVKDD